MSLGCKQAVILAAGRGSRLGDASANKPKCLYPLAGRPLLDWSLDALATAGIERSLLVAGWQWQQLTHYPVTLQLHSNWEQTQSVGSLLQAHDWCQREPTLIIYGDCVHSAAVLRAALEAPASDILVPGDSDWWRLWSLRSTSPLTDAESWQHEGDRLLSIGQRIDRPESAAAQFAGLIRLTPAGWQQISEHCTKVALRDGPRAVDRLDMTALLAQLLRSGASVGCHLFQGGWLELDTTEDAERYEACLAAGGFSHDFRPAERQN